MGKLWMMVCPGYLKTGAALGGGQVGVWAVLSCPLSEQDRASWEAREDPLASERATDCSCHAVSALESGTPQARQALENNLFTTQLHLMRGPSGTPLSRQSCEVSGIELCPVFISFSFAI